MKKFLEDLLAKRKAELAKATERNAAATTVEEVRAIGETLLALKDEIADIEKQLADLDKEDDNTDPSGDEGASRGLNPLASYGQQAKPEARKANESPRSSMEYRQAFMDYVKVGKRSSVLQYRNDDMNVSSDLGVLMPETVIQEIIKGVEKVYGQLYSRVKKTNLKGGVKYPIGSFSATFNRIFEVAGEDNNPVAPTERQKGGAVSGYVEFTYKLGEIRIAQSLLANVVSVPVFENELAKVIVEAYVKAMDTEIMTGDPDDGECEGILTEAAKGSSGRIASANIITFTADEIADWKNWQTKLFAKIPLSMRGLKPEFVLTANTYEANIKTLHDDNNRPVYAETYNPVDGTEKATFKGHEVVFVEEDILDSFDSADANDYFGMYWVPEKAYAINTNLEFAVKRYFDEEKLQYVDRAVVINDGKILDAKYIYLLKKVASA